MPLQPKRTGITGYQGYTPQQATNVPGVNDDLVRFLYWYGFKPAGPEDVFKGNAGIGQNYGQVMINGMPFVYDIRNANPAALDILGVTNKKVLGTFGAGQQGSLPGSLQSNDQLLKILLAAMGRKGG